MSDEIDSETTAKAETETIEVWMVDRGYTNRDLITLTYATPDGERALHTEQAATTMARDSGPTAAREVDPERLSAVTDEDERERYRREANRTMAQYDPDESI